MDMIVSLNVLEDTLTWFNHTNTTKTYQPLVSMFTPLLLNQKTINHQGLAISVELTMPLLISH